jgi:hypothetical protein
MVLLYGRAGHLTAKNGGFRPGQILGLDYHYFGDRCVPQARPELSASARLVTVDPYQRPEFGPRSGPIPRDLCSAART